jgi:succinylglutamic semialdehyde dehydrogenase
MGPLVNATAVDRLLEEQQRLIEYGSTPIVHAERLSLGECFVSPGLLDVTHCTRRSDEEIFGPLLQVIRVDNLSQAIEEANDTEFGLAAGILTAQREDFDRFRHEVRSGLINWNLPTTGASGRLPFGGLGHSGNYRPAGYHAIDFCNAAVAELEPLESADGSQ